MPLPTPNPTPPFNITRASHVVLTSRDLDATRAFYEQALGFDVTDQTSDRLYLRGLEERGHHSMVFHKQDGPRQCLRMGYRMYTDDDIRAALDHFLTEGRDAKLVEVEHQGLTLHVTDPVGVPVEFVATMEQRPRALQQFHRHRGGKPMHFDHTQIYSHDVPTAMHWYMGLGFRLTEIIGPEGVSEPPAVWLQRKGGTQDVVYNTAPGPQLHHCGYHAPGIVDLINAADTAAAMGFSKSVERGPGRHGISNALFMYFRDPDGHRVELFTDHYMAIDSDFEVIRWDPKDPAKAQTWGLPGTRRYYTEAAPFAGSDIRQPASAGAILTLEDYLAEDAKRPYS